MLEEEDDDEEEDDAVAGDIELEDKGDDEADEAVKIIPFGLYSSNCKC